VGRLPHPPPRPPIAGNCRSKGEILMRHSAAFPNTRNKTERHQIGNLWEDPMEGSHRLPNRYRVTTKLNSVARVSERTIPTERLPLVGEVSANFCG
jgi:hypothetical protein